MKSLFYSTKRLLNSTKSRKNSMKTLENSTEIGGDSTNLYLMKIKSAVEIGEWEKAMALSHNKTAFRWASLNWESM
jgi:hypothetical protein